MKTTLRVIVLVVLLAHRTLADDEKTLLSRKKRYLTFPEGSSLQLVFCLTLPVIGHANIFTLGSTAALAWELPHEPFKKTLAAAAAAATKKTDKIDTPNNNFDTLRLTNPAPSSNIEYIDEWNSVPPSATNFLHPVYHHIHRRTRRDLYSKIEKLLKIQSKDGRACLLKSVCEVNKIGKGRGTFMQEIIKTVLMVKPHEGFEDEDEYDKAANKNHTCSELYPTCQDSLLDFFY